MDEKSGPENVTVVIDGPAGAGKSTVARRVARELGYMLLDTGAIYRTLALSAREAGVDWSDAEGLASVARDLAITFRMEQDVNHVLLDGRDVSEAIRTPEMSLGASQVSALGPVRAALLELQRQFARSMSVVAEGRDMGTVVFTDAKVKIFLVADPEVRARRRLQELRAMGHEVSLDEVLQQQNQRDEADSGRDVAPLKPAEDAVMLDTSGLDVDQVVERIMDQVKERGGAAA